MQLSESQFNRVLDQLRAHHYLLTRLSEISELAETRVLASDTDALLTELERITQDDDIDALLEVCNV